MPKYIEENMNQWVLDNSGNGNYYGVLKDFSFQEGFTLRPALIANHKMFPDGKTIPKFYIEQDRPLGIPYNNQIIVPMRWDNLKELLELNKDENSKQLELNL